MTNDGKHTPGPWFNTNGLIHKEGDSATKQWLHLASVFQCPGLPSGEGDANAALIASAPDMRAEMDRKDALIQEMLEALKDIQPVHTSPVRRRFVQQLRPDDRYRKTGRHRDREG